jgi:hypothetical protein
MSWTAIAAAASYYNSMKSSNVNGTPSFTFEENRTVISGAISATIETFLLGTLGMPALPVEVKVNAALANGGSGGTDYEVSIMLDLTGSMCDDGQGPCSTGSKLSALKTAASDLVNIMVWDDQSKYKSRVAVVPFATRMRVAPDGQAGPIMKRLTNLDPTWSGWLQSCTAASGTAYSESNGTWQCTAYTTQEYSNQAIFSCVTDRTGPQEFTDAAPGPNTWLNGHSGDRQPVSLDSSDTPMTSNIGLSAADPSYQLNYFGTGGCADITSSNEILPLTADKTALKAKIEGLSAYGSTSGALGTAWAWYMLSPKWDQIWTGASRPAPYSELTELRDGRPKLKKVAVLMSDGEYNTYRGWKESDPVLVTNNAKAICQNMKNAGIEIYTVGFGLDQLAADRRALAEATLKACGTDLEHFYHAVNANELKSAFRDIGVKMSFLRLGK